MLVLTAKRERRSCTEPWAGSQTPAQSTSEEEGTGLNFHPTVLGSQNVSCFWTSQGLGQERGLPFGRNACERVGDVEGCPLAEHVMGTNTGQHTHILISSSSSLSVSQRSQQKSRGEAACSGRQKVTSCRQTSDRLWVSFRPPP